MTQRQPTQPSKSLLEGKPYTPAHATDIRETFRRARYQQLKEQPCATAGTQS
jgi:hypothetical protein